MFTIAQFLWVGKIPIAMSMITGFMSKGLKTLIHWQLYNFPNISERLYLFVKENKK